jgi:hypothetical protein
MLERKGVESAESGTPGKMYVLTTGPGPRYEVVAKYGSDELDRDGRAKFGRGHRFENSHLARRAAEKHYNWLTDGPPLNPYQDQRAAVEAPRMTGPRALIEPRAVEDHARKLAQAERGLRVVPDVDAELAEIDRELDELDGGSIAAAEDAAIPTREGMRDAILDALAEDELNVNATTRGGLTRIYVERQLSAGPQKMGYIEIDEDGDVNAAQMVRAKARIRDIATGAIRSYRRSLADLAPAAPPAQARPGPPPNIVTHGGTTWEIIASPQGDLFWAYRKGSKQWEYSSPSRGGLIRELVTHGRKYPSAAILRSRRAADASTAQTPPAWEDFGDAWQTGSATYVIQHIPGDRSIFRVVVFSQTSRSVTPRQIGERMSSESEAQRFAAKHYADEHGLKKTIHWGMTLGALENIRLEQDQGITPQERRSRERASSTSEAWARVHAAQEAEAERTNRPRPTSSDYSAATHQALATMEANQAAVARMVKKARDAKSATARRKAEASVERAKLKLDRSRVKFDRLERRETFAWAIMEYDRRESSTPVPRGWDTRETTISEEILPTPRGVTVERGYWQIPYDGDLAPPPVYPGLPVTQPIGAHQAAGVIVDVNKTGSRISVRLYDTRKPEKYSWRKGRGGFMKVGDSGGSRLMLGKAVEYLDPGV